MKLQTRLFLASGAVGVVALAGMASLTAFAAAAVTPTVTTVVQNSSNSTLTSALVGTSVHAVVTVASSTATTSPTGTVDFNLYSNQTCSGTPLTQSAVVLVNGSASSSNATLAAGGLSYQVHYNGQDTTYNAANSVCMPVSATQFAPALSLSLSNSNVLAGSVVNAIPNLTGETAGADGTLQYRVYTNNTCTTLAASGGDKTVTNGSTPNSDALQFITAGTYYWQAAYLGDADNAAATSSCTGAILTVVATSSTPTTTPSVPGTISGTLFNDLNKNDIQNSGEAGLAGWTVWLHKTSTTTDNWFKKLFKKHDSYNDPIVATATTDANGNYSFGNLSNGTYFVEESVMTGWKQTSDDTKVVLTATKTSADVDFSNIQKSATSTKPVKGDKDHDGDNDDATSTNNGTNGNHNGWFKINANLGGWLHIGKK